MAEYIDRKALISTLNENKIPFNADINYFITNAPTADVTEVVHGYWKWKELYGEVGYMLVCSECEESEGACVRFDYCPNCGAKMDLE